jgi:hypothetical protein
MAGFSFAMKDDKYHVEDYPLVHRSDPLTLRKAVGARLLSGELRQLLAGLIPEVSRSGDGTDGMLTRNTIDVVYSEVAKLQGLDALKRVVVADNAVFPLMGYDEADLRGHNFERVVNQLPIKVLSSRLALAWAAS